MYDNLIVLTYNYGGVDNRNSFGDTDCDDDDDEEEEEEKEDAGDNHKYTICGGCHFLNDVFIMKLKINIQDWMWWLSHFIVSDASAASSFNCLLSLSLSLFPSLFLSPSPSLAQCPNTNSFQLSTIIYRDIDDSNCGDN